MECCNSVFLSMKSNLITRTGHDLLVAELKKLWHDERPEITKKVNWAASLGDRSENADSKLYPYFSYYS